ncbi:uncharacterized protein LOC111038125 isoform X1 [Myzus persicae]|uniref:uncharacterized protein LOC111038125 isoform X1 n=1 Tax=Myzus persicae TaxID=13164 RepID=UPI000B932C3D|nr:uncharacterized protein LOC111038125 isoform X1 [Myzus persicae]
MASKLKTTDTDKLNMGMKSIVNEFKISCDKVKQLKDNKELFNQMEFTVKTLSIEGENDDYATQFSNFKEAVKNEQSFYFNKTGITHNFLSKNEQLESAANILQETGIDDYNASSIFTKYLSMIEKCNKQKEFIDDIDEHLNKLKIVIEQQNDLKCELSNINYSPVGYTAEPINIKPIKSIQTVDDCDEIVKLVKKITDIEKKQEEIYSATSELKSEQKKMYHGLPPNMDQAMMTVQIAEQAMKAISKKLMEKL